MKNLIGSESVRSLVVTGLLVVANILEFNGVVHSVVSDVPATAIACGDFINLEDLLAQMLIG